MQLHKNIFTLFQVSIIISWCSSAFIITTSAAIHYNQNLPINLSEDPQLLDRSTEKYYTNFTIHNQDYNYDQTENQPEHKFSTGGFHVSTITSTDIEGETKVDSFQINIQDENDSWDTIEDSTDVDSLTFNLHTVETSDGDNDFNQILQVKLDSGSELTSVSYDTQEIRDGAHASHSESSKYADSVTPQIGVVFVFMGSNGGLFSLFGALILALLLCCCKCYRLVSRYDDNETVRESRQSGLTVVRVVQRQQRIDTGADDTVRLISSTTDDTNIFEVPEVIQIQQPNTLTTTSLLSPSLVSEETDPPPSYNEVMHDKICR